MWNKCHVSIHFLFLISNYNHETTFPDKIELWLYFIFKI